MKEKLDMEKTLMKCVDTFILEGSRIDKISVERKWEEIVDEDEPWIAKRKYAGYAEILVEFVPTDKKGK